MADMGQLQDIAGFLSRKEAWNAILAAANEEQMLVEENFRYLPIERDCTIIATHVAPFLTDPIPENTEMSLVIFTEPSAPHFHETSDGVIVTKSTDGSERLPWERLLGNGSWHQLGDGEMLVLPRRMVHGLRPMQGVRDGLYAITVNNPPLPEEDIVYA